MILTPLYCVEFKLVTAYSSGNAAYSVSPSVWPSAELIFDSIDEHRHLFNAIALIIQCQKIVNTKMDK